MGDVGNLSIESNGPVAADMLVQEVLLRYPATLAVFKRFGFPCPHCMASVYETVAQVAVMLDVPLPSLLASLNEEVHVSAAPPLVLRLPFGREPNPN